MTKSNRKKLNSPESFATAFNKHQNLYTNPKGKKKTKLLSIKLIGVGNNGKFKQEKVYLPTWRIDSIQITFNHNQKVSLSLSEIKQQLTKKQRKKAPKKEID